MADDSDANQPGGDLTGAENDADQNFSSGNNVGDSSPACCAVTSSATVSADKKHFVEILLVDQEDKPVPGQAYQITVPGGTVVSGTTDAKGRGRVDGIDAGNCRITFTALDRDVWRKK